MTDHTGAAARRLVSVVLVVAIAIGIVVQLSTVVVRRALLDEATYTSALVEVDAYERFYTEVLSDPEMAAIQEELLGRIRLGPVLAPQARTLTNNVLRWTVPPATLRTGAEVTIGATLAYVRGDVDRLEVDLDLAGMAERVEAAVATHVAALLSQLATAEVVATIEEYRLAARSFLDELSAGRVPSSVPVIGGSTVDPDLVTAAILDPLGIEVDDSLRRRVSTAAAAGVDSQALIDAASVAIGDHVGRVVAERWAAEVDLVAAIDARAERAGAAVDSLDGARDVAAVFGPTTALAAALGVVLAAIALAWMHRESPRRAAALVAVAAIGGGVATLALWAAIRGRVAAPLDRASGTSSDGWALPRGVQSVAGDVRSAVGDSIAALVRREAAVPILVGLALLVVVFVLPALARRLPAVRPGHVLVAVGGFLVLVGAGFVLSTPSAADHEERACNGHVELCERRYDEVVQAGTHNSMSSPGVVDVWPEHDGDLRAQLDAGVHVLLIDTHYWGASISAEQIAAADQNLPPALAAVLLRAAEPFAEQRDGTWLCHNHCAFGGMPFLDGLVAVREFLEDNPHDVVTLIIQDAITTDDTVAVVEDAGLLPYVHVHEVGTPWATLDEMIDAGERLVVFAEQERPPPDWYMNAFEHMQETPFTVLAPNRFTCEPNRGDPEAPLFLLNHWVQRVAPDRTDSVVVNAHDFLVDRARQCQRERGLMPNFLAVNFYNVGDVVEAAATLNGVGRDR